MSVNTLSSNFSSDVSTYIAKKTLMLAVKMLAVYQFADKVPLPKNEGRVFQYTRYDRVALPRDPLTEGTTPSDSSMSISTVSATMDQWGAVIPLSDVSIDSVKHPVLQKAINLAALQASETLDREIVRVLLSGTNVFFPNAIASRPNLTSSDKLGSSVIGKVVSNLRANGAMGYDGDLYVGVIHPFAEDDITVDTTFVDAAKYGMIKKLLVNEVGTWKGVRWVRSNSLPKIKLLTGASAADSATAGSLSASTAYDFKLAVVDASTKHETFISATFSGTTGMGHSSLDITIPALPSGATASSKFRIYAGSSGGTLYKAIDDVSASSTYNFGSAIPTSGYVAQAAPPASLGVYCSWIFGKESFSCVELNKIKAFMTPAAPSDSDPLVQRRKVGWKADFKAVINNELFLGRIEHVTTNGT